MGKKLILASFLLALFSNAQDNFFKDFKEKNLTNVVYDNGMNGSKKKDFDPVGKEGNDGKWPGIGPEGEAPNTAVLHYTRIPSMVITNDNKIIVMYDLRWYKYEKDKNNGNKDKPYNKSYPLGSDHGRIDAGVSISSDGGKTWENHTAISFNDKWHENKPQINRRRIMDATLLYNHLTGDLYTLHGSWNEFLSRTRGGGGTGHKVDRNTMKWTFGRL